MAQPGKRHRDHQDDDFTDEASRDEDILVTPGPNRTLADLESLVSTSTRSSRQSASSASRKSSPRKQMRTAERVSKGFVHEKFYTNMDRLSPSLSRLREKLERIETGVGILPAAAKEEVDGQYLSWAAPVQSTPSLKFVPTIAHPPSHSRLRIR